MSNFTWGPFSLDNKAVVVTGGALGIGFGIAKRCIEAGGVVCLADVDAGALKRALERLEVGTDRAVSVVVDVAAEDAGARIVTACVDAFGTVDVLVNNAGIFPQVPAMAMTPALFDRVIGINLRGLVSCRRRWARR
jgi:2-deoxy-D-gluconate 3-dehydrogenase